MYQQPEYIGDLFYYSKFYNKTLKIKINPKLAYTRYLIIFPQHVFLSSLPNSLHASFLLSMMDYSYFSGPDFLLSHLRAFAHANPFHSNAFSFLACMMKTFSWNFSSTATSAFSVVLLTSSGQSSLYLFFSMLPQYFVLTYFLVLLTL